MKIKLLNYIKLLNNKLEKEINGLKTEIKKSNDILLLNDVETGLQYELFIKNGELVSKLKADAIEIVALPEKLEYIDGEPIDLTGLSLNVIYPNGDKVLLDMDSENISYRPLCAKEEDPFVYIALNGASVSFAITVNVFDPAVVLIDFNYTDNGDGTYTLVSWKQTYNGISSSELIIPDNENIIL